MDLELRLFCQKALSHSTQNKQNLCSSPVILSYSTSLSPAPTLTEDVDQVIVSELLKAGWC